jgi:hypothetical protein
MCGKDHAFVHESGHAIMAVLRGLFLSGVCFCTSDQKYCTLTGMPSAKLSKDDYLYSAAGMAAELVVYGNYDDGPAKLDKADFKNHDAPPLEDTINEARNLLSAYDNQIRKLAANLLEKDQQKEKLPEVGMDNDPRKFRVLLTRDDVDEAIRS